MNQMELDTKHQTEWVIFEMLRIETLQQTLSKQCWERLWGTNGEFERQLRNEQESERILLRLGINAGDTRKLRCIVLLKNSNKLPNSALYNTTNNAE
ncbi:MAG: hypothetical protein ACTHMC_02855 [Pseudobacter sp.]|uniref:hypothetical protein n=1 Tax=Pseudobacter sp. TaxID=2045420 RepID=UPI003F7CE76E